MLFQLPGVFYAQHTSMLHRLPVELISNICSFTSQSDLVSLCKSSRILYEAAVPYLYRCLYIFIDYKGPDYASSQLLATLQSERRGRVLGSYIRDIMLESDGCEHGGWIHVLVASLIQIVSRLPKTQLRMMWWTFAVPHTIDIRGLLSENMSSLGLDRPTMAMDLYFPSLVNLRCLRYEGAQQEGWVAKHILLPSLKSLRLGSRSTWLRGLFLSRPMPRFLSLPASYPLTYSRLESLTLNSLDLAGWPYLSMPNLKHLSLRYCHNVQTAFDAYMTHNARTCRIRALTLITSERNTQIREFLTWLGGRTCLTDLKLCLWDSQSHIPLSYLAQHRSSLERVHLDTRQHEDQQLGVHVNTHADFFDLLQWPNLAYLAMALALSTKGDRAAIVGV